LPQAWAVGCKPKTGGTRDEKQLKSVDVAFGQTKGSEDFFAVKEEKSSGGVSHIWIGL